MLNQILLKLCDVCGTKAWHQSSMWFIFDKRGPGVEGWSVTRPMGNSKVCRAQRMCTAQVWMTHYWPVMSHPDLCLGHHCHNANLVIPVGTTSRAREIIHTVQQVNSP